jgi:hypothetical protein
MNLPPFGRLFLRSSAALATAVALWSSPALADVPTRLPIQGFLSDSGGAPIDGTIPAAFSIYSSASGGSPLYTESVNLVLDTGNFVVTLGASNALSAAMFRDNNALYLGISVDGELEMAPRLALDTVAYAFRAQFASDSLGMGGMAASSWQQRVTGACASGSSIRGVNANGTVLCETDDGGPAYTAGSGLTLAGTEFAVDTSALQVRVSGTCPSGQYIRAIDSVGAVTCQADNGGTSYTAGGGLLLTGTTFSVDSSAVQARVTGTCPVGQYIRAIDSAGLVSCAVDDGGQNYVAGTGLDLTGTTFAIDPNEAQARVGGTCPSGSSIRAINSNGTVSCETDDNDGGDITGVTAGTGLTGGATTGDATLTVNTTVIQSRVTGNCAANEYIRTINADGTVACGADNGGTVYVAGAGLDLAGGTTFNVDPTEVQTRVGGTCPAGQYIRAIAQDGTVTCQADDGGQTYAAGTGLSLGGPLNTTFAINPAETQVRIAGTCPAGSSIRAVDANGSVSCEADDNSGGTLTTVTAGSGLSGGGSGVSVTLSVNTSAIQARVTGSCVAGEYIRAIDATGAVTCQADNGGTVYAAGTGLTLTGSTFAVNPVAVQTRVTGTCAAGEYVRAIGQDGTVTCQADNGGTVYTAGTGLTLTGAQFAANPAVVQSRVTANCAAGNSIRQINQDGTVVCEDDTDTNTTYSAGTGLTLAGTTFNVNSASVQLRGATTACGSGQYVRSIDAAGNVACFNDVDTDTNTTYSAGAGLGLAGTTFSVDTGAIQARVVGTCGAGTFVTAIASNGGVTCAASTTGDITSVNAGSGLSGGAASGDATLSVNTGVIQARVTGTCSVGDSIRTINADGTVVCDGDEPDIFGLRAGDMITGGGNITWNGSTFNWNQRFILIGNGRSSNAAASGYFDIDRPADGTQIPVIGTGGTVTVSGGIPIGGPCSWQSLFYILPVGSTNGSIASNFRIVDYCAGTFDVPADWVVLATRNDDQGFLSVNVNGGFTMRPGQTYSAANGTQQRVTGTCAVGNAIRAIDINGNVTCEDFNTMAAVLRSPTNVTGGGTVRFDTSGYLSWNDRFIIISNGNGANFSTNGYFDISMPAAGTGVNVIGGAGARNWTAQGVVLNGWEALYYVLPVGSSNGSVAGNFYVASYPGASTIPQNAVLLAVRNGDANGSLLVLANGGFNLQPGGQYIAGFSNNENAIYSVSSNITTSIDDTGGWTTIWSGGTDDALSGIIPLGFNFRMFGRTYNSMQVSTNGWLSLNNGSGASHSFNSNNGGFPNDFGCGDCGVVAAFWDDLRAAGSVRYRTLGAAPARIMVVVYDMDMYSYGSFIDFTVAIFEGTGTIVFRYHDVDTNDRSKGSDATIGIQGPYVSGATPSMSFSHLAPVLDDNANDLGNRGAQQFVSFNPN